MGRLASIDQKHGTDTIAEYFYSWDTANRITSMNDALYGYDATSQLTSATYEKLPEELYQYDANGNRKNFETGKNNQLLSDGVFDYKYDDEGNRVSKVSKNSKTEYFWDHRNRLIRVLDNGKSVEYTYDHQNRLVRRNDELFIHDGWQIACSIRDGKVEHRYLWGAKRDELIATNDQFALCDHLGSVRDVVNAGGNALNHVEYNAFGKIMNQTGKSDCVFGYTSKLFNDATALQWNINRWYDPNVGRWISEDPIGFGGKDGNLCCYVHNHSVNQNDPFGLAGATTSHGDGKCKIQMHCYDAAAGGVAVGIHCGLTMDYNGETTTFDGTGMADLWPPYNKIDTTWPYGNNLGFYPDPPQTYDDDEPCRCLQNYAGTFNNAKMPLGALEGNSNWVLSCMVRECKVDIPWTQVPQHHDPTGYGYGYPPCEIRSRIWPLCWECIKHYDCP